MADVDAEDQAREWSDALAAAWERNRDRIFESQRRVSEWLVARLDPRPGQTILELAAGPGETGFLAAERIGPEGRLISTDVGPKMVDAARRGASARSLGNVECRVMDAQDVDLPDASVDGVLCRFGLMLMPEPERALAGVRRILRPGGRLAYAVWGGPDRNPWMSLIAQSLIQRGHEPPGNPFEQGGPFSLSDPNRNRVLLRDAGFEDLVVEELADVMHYEDFDDYWGLQRQVGGPTALFIASLPDQERQGIRAAVEAMAEPFASEEGYGFPSLALTVAASAPAS